MLLENCCYGRYEMLVLNMVRQGLFGDVVHCAGGYLHDLRDEIAFGEENRHYRLRNYLHRNCENYPTHELGPIAKVLNINRGNRMVTLTSMASCSRGMHEFIRNNDKANKELLNTPFNQGDIVSTMIRCANGETIHLTLDTTLPRSYCRGFTVRGTRGMYQEENNTIYLDEMNEHFNARALWDNADKFFEKYEHPVWNDFLHNGVKGGHGGMDFLVYDAFVKAVLNGTQMPIDVYDAAAWMCITPLSEQSIQMGSMPVAIPDFTNGRYCNRTDKVEGPYALD
jgi:hypothetical protein